MRVLIYALTALLLPLLIAAGAQGCQRTPNPYDHEGTHVILHTDADELFDCIQVGVGSGTHLINCRPTVEEGR